MHSQRVLKDKHLKLQLQTDSGRLLEAIWFNHSAALPARVRLEATQAHHLLLPALPLLPEHLAQLLDLLTHLFLLCVAHLQLLVEDARAADLAQASEAGVH